MHKFHFPRGKKGRWLILAVGIAAIAAVIGFFVLQPGTGEGVNVYPFTYIGMTEYWGDTQESYGPVSTDKIQTVFLSDTQTVTELLVKEGDQVKKGDLLMTFDTSLSELQLERKRLEMEKEKLQWEQDKKKLAELLNTTPWEGPASQPALPEADPGDSLAGKEPLFLNTDLDGSAEEKAAIYWLRTGQTVDHALLQDIYQKILQFHAAASQSPSNPSQIPQAQEDPLEDDPVIVVPEEEVSPPVDAGGDGSGDTGSDGGDSGSTGGDTGGSGGDTGGGTLPPPDSFYVIFRVSLGDLSNQEILTWQGLHVQVLSGGFSFQFFPTYYGQDLDPFYIAQNPITMPETDDSVGYTEEELQKLIAQQRKTIQEQEFKVRMAENAYKLMEKELSDGNIYAEIDGSVVSVLEAEEAKLTQKPIVKVSGGGGYVIRGSVSELEKDKLTLGQEVTVNDWNTGGSYPGTIQEIGDFPSSGNGWNGMGNPTATYYPFTVFVEESANLQSGMYASIQYSSGSGSHGIYLQNPFIRTEDGQSYVLVRNAAGQLEKRTVVTGKTLWGSYTEILSGVTEEDFLAFPYGKEAKAGANAQEGSLEELYSY